MSNGLIPVADEIHRPTMAMRDVEHGTSRTMIVDRGRPILLVLLVWVLFHFTQVGRLEKDQPWDPILAGIRYALWPAIVIAMIDRLVKNDGPSLVASLRYFVPFVLIGVLVSLIGFYPAFSLRYIAFWVFGAAAAASIGAGVSSAAIRSTLFWTFMTLVAASAAFSVLVPKLGITQASGVSAWSGLFPSKNSTGLICVYAMLFAFFAPRPARSIRVLGAIGATALLILASSQGAVVVAGLAIGYMILIGLLRRSSLSNGARAGVLAILSLGVVFALTFGGSYILALLGRDATFSGRTEIWSAFLTRASYFWLTGAGPGSFSVPGSPVTADLSYRFASLGRIYTPHNMFIAAFGELGFFGLLAFAIPLLYFAFLFPFVDTERGSLMASTVAFTMIVGGISETREVFGLGMNMFLLILAVAAAQRSARFDRVGVPGTPSQGTVVDTSDTLYQPHTGPRVLG